MNTPFLTYEAAGLAVTLIRPTAPAEFYRRLRHHGSALQMLSYEQHYRDLFSAAEGQLLCDFSQRGCDSELGQRVAAIQQDLQNQSVHILSLGADNYPQLLASAPDAPVVLYVKGNMDALHLPTLGIVGARHCSAQGGENADRFAQSLAQGGFCVVSGLAAGIDARAHSGALAASGSTVAVMATGIDRIYPKRHHALAERILANNGALVTEFPLGTAPLRRHFPQRNRIISGLSLGVLVVEAKLKSGSLITARTAITQDREVFAIPGSIHNPMVKGCHQLIKNGAKLVESIEDIMEELPGLLALKQEELKLAPARGDKPAQNPLLAALAFEAKTLDQLANETSLPIETLMVELVSLEMEGKIIQTDGLVERVVF